MNIYIVLLLKLQADLKKEEICTSLMQGKEEVTQKIEEKIIIKLTPKSSQDEHFVEYVKLFWDQFPIIRVIFYFIHYTLLI